MMLKGIQKSQRGGIVQYLKMILFLVTLLVFSSSTTVVAFADNYGAQNKGSKIVVEKKNEDRDALVDTSSKGKTEPGLNEAVPVDDLVLFAKDFIARRTSALIGTAKTTPAFPLAKGVARESMPVLAAEQLSHGELNARRDVLREWDEAYTHSVTELTLQRADIKDGVVTLDIEEFTKLYYDKIHGDEPDYTAWVSDRRFVFENGAAGWELVSQELLGDQGPAPVNEPTGVTEDAMRRALARLAAAPVDENAVKARKDAPKELGSTDIRTQAIFNRYAARDYARKYWTNYNTAYRDFSGSGDGGDCTNFVSQAMRWGGWTDVSGWYRNTNYWWYNSLNQTWSWVGVQHWYEFALLNSHRTFKISNPLSMTIGDVLQADWTNNGTKNHSMIVTYRSSTPMVYLTYHSRDTYERSFSSLSTSYPNARWFPHGVSDIFS